MDSVGVRFGDQKRREENKNVGFDNNRYPGG
jgi:hypothetical protein